MFESADYWFNGDLWWIPNFFSEFGGQVTMLWWWIFILTMVTFIGVWVVFIYFIWKYRERPGQEGKKAHYTHGSHKLEVAWTLAPTLILMATALWSNHAWAEAKQKVPAEDDIGLTIRVVAQQFNWNVIYPGPDGVLDTKVGTTPVNDDYVIPDTFVVPAGQHVRIKLTSQDVLHSLFIPHMCVKQDAVPGFIGNVFFRCDEVNDPGSDGKYNPTNIFGVDRDPPPAKAPRAGAVGGSYQIVCAELCGQGHYDMGARLTVMPRADFDEWVKQEAARR